MTIANYLWNVTCTEFENQSVSDEVMTKTSWHTFLTHSVYILYSVSQLTLQGTVAILDVIVWLYMIMTRPVDLV